MPHTTPSDFFSGDNEEMIRGPSIVHGKAKAPWPSVVPHGQLEPEVQVRTFGIAKRSVVVRVVFQLPPNGIEHSEECVSAQTEGTDNSADFGSYDEVVTHRSLVDQWTASLQTRDNIADGLPFASVQGRLRALKHFFADGRSGPIEPAQSRAHLGRKLLDILKTGTYLRRPRRCHPVRMLRPHRFENVAHVLINMSTTTVARKSMACIRRR